MTKILTNSGLWFDFLDPQPDQICLHDIAHALSRICRYGGHTYQHYSVAQHSLLVASLLVDESPLIRQHGLLHDAPEAYTGDIVSPLKALLNIEEHEQRAQDCIFRALSVPSISPKQAKLVHEADYQAYLLERNAGLTAWPSDGSKIHIMSYQESYTEFTKLMLKLQDEI